MDRVISHSAGRMKEKKSGVLADMMNSRIVTASLSLATTVQLWAGDRKSTRLNSSHSGESRMPSSA